MGTGYFTPIPKLCKFFHSFGTMGVRQISFDIYNLFTPPFLKRSKIRGSNFALIKKFLENF